MEGIQGFLDSLLTFLEVLQISSLEPLCKRACLSLLERLSLLDWSASIYHRFKLASLLIRMPGSLNLWRGSIEFLTALSMSVVIGLVCEGFIADALELALNRTLVCFAG